MIIADLLIILYLGKLCQITATCTYHSHIYVASFEGKLFSRWLLWNVTVTKRLDCAVLCESDERCVSYQVNTGGFICRGYGVNFNVNSTSIPVTGFLFYETPRGKGYIGSACVVNTDCTFASSFCVNNECMCDPGLAFSPRQKACLSGCTSYGSEFAVIGGYFIGGNNDQTYKGVSLDQCMDNCIAASSFVCRSADFSPSSDGRCDLSSQTLMTVASSDYHVMNDISVITHYSRDCAA